MPDAILRQTPLDTIEPSPEATEVFRSVGDWHLTHRRWKAAAECYQLLPMANRFIPEENISDTGDMIRPAPAFVLAGMDDAYVAHRKLLIERFAGTSTPNTAQQVVEMSLLRPAPPEIITRLRPAVEFLQKLDPAEQPRMHILAHTALSLYELRSGNPSAAIQQADRALELCRQHPGGATADFQAFLHPILLMACRQTGDDSRAAAELERVKQYVQTHGETFDQPIPFTDNDFLPVIERALAMILAREALAAE